MRTECCEDSLWARLPVPHAVCVPTTGRLNSDGELYLCAEMAREVKRRFPSFSRDAGRLVDLYGNVPHMLEYPSHAGDGVIWRLITFPVKTAGDSPLKALRAGANALAAFVNHYGHLQDVLVPVPVAAVAGEGEAAAAASLKVLETVFDDRFSCVCLPVRKAGRDD